jgi:hypothetical protein
LQSHGLDANRLQVEGSPRLTLPGPCPSRLCQRIGHNLVLRARLRGQFRQVAGGGRIHPGFEQRQNFVPDSVAARVHGQVGGILAPPLALGGEPVAEVLRIQVQQGAHPGEPMAPGKGGHAPRPARRSAPAEAEQHGFRLVAAVVREGDKRAIRLHRHFRQSSAAQGAAGHFQGYPVAGAAGGVHTAGMKGQSQLAGQRLHPRVVAVRFHPSQAVVHVAQRHGQIELGREPGQAEGEGDGVRAAGNPGQQAGAAGNQAPEGGAEGGEHADAVAARGPGQGTVKDRR